MAEGLTVPEFPEENTLSKRVGHLVAVGGLPAAALSVLGDITGPKGGWVAVLAAGVVALVCAVFALAYLSARNPNAAPPLFYRKFFHREEFSWAWTSRPVIACHGLHVLLVFGVLCLLAANRTYAEQGEGGVLAKHFDMVADAQKKLGLMQAQLEEQRKTNQNLQALHTEVGTLKKETSDDPRKELANLRLQWTVRDFETSVELGDLKAVRLYVQAGFTPTYRQEYIASKALETQKPELIELVASRLDAIENMDHTPGAVMRCNPIFWARSLQNNPSDQAKALVRKVCSGPAVREMFRNHVTTLRKEEREPNYTKGAVEYREQEEAKYMSINRWLHMM